jgi:hypothetical protein
MSLNITSDMPFCYICNRIVEVVGRNMYPDCEESLFSWGHTSRLFKRSISESVNITEKVEITPKEGESDSRET